MKYNQNHNSHGYKKNRGQLITKNDWFGKHWEAKHLGKLLRILQNVREKFHKLTNSSTG
jgi:hypothetical protein